MDPGLDPKSDASGVERMSRLRANTRVENLRTISVEGLLAGGGGIITAIHAQLGLQPVRPREVPQRIKMSTTSTVVIFSSNKSVPEFCRAIAQSRHHSIGYPRQQDRNCLVRVARPPKEGWGTG